MTSPKPPAQDFPLDAADRCVMCGLCLAHCPTYRLTLNEGESPRGRIALMTALARGTLAPTPHLFGHLDRCLGCRACESMCPSKVPYGTLIDRGQTLLRQPPLDRPRPRWRTALQGVALNGILAHPARVLGLARVLRLAQRSGLTRLARWIGLGRAADLLPRLPATHRWRNCYPATSPHRGDVALFTGCLGAVADGTGNRAAIDLLNRCGYTVHIPPEQACCGALHLHSGDRLGAERLARRNVQAFRDLPVEAIVSTASACTLMLCDYATLLPDAAPMTKRVQEVSSFLAQQTWPQEQRPRALKATVAVHHPCSQVHGLNSHHYSIELLRRIPGIDIVPLPTKGYCCGGAGSYMLRQADMADTLADEVLDQITAGGARLVVSANIGCLLQLQARARQRQIDLEILHPLELLQRQLHAFTPTLSHSK